MEKADKKKIDFTAFKSVVKEFLNALKQNRTYNIQKNWYSIFGLLWGLPIPIVTIGIYVHSSGITPNISNIVNIIVIHPIQFFFLLHPLIFGILFGAMGTVRYNKDREIKEFEKSLISKNRELEEINKKLQELDELKSNFLKMVSHELRTPLTTILGYISFLKTQKAGRLTKGQLESLELSEDEAVRLDKLIEELLDITKIETGTFKVNLQNTDINQVMDRVIKSLLPLAERKRITLVNELPDELPDVLADQDKIIQVIVNLIENGIKFNNPGGKVSVSSVVSSVDKKIRICISDTGIGIEPKKLDRIFEKFYQIDSADKRRYGGCGLGLAISKSIVELHNGSIEVESKIGKGSKFYIELLNYNKDKSV